MRRPRVILVLLALGVGAVVVWMSDRPVSRSVVHRPIAWEDARGVQGELARVQAAYEQAGTPVRRHVVGPEQSSLVVTADAPEGGCASVVGGASGQWRIASVRWWPYGRPRAASDKLAERGAYPRLGTAEACPMRGRGNVRFEVRLVRGGPGGAEILVADGPLPPISTAAIEGDRVTLEEREWTPALAKGLSLAGFVLLLGLMVEGAVRARREPRDGRRSLRRLSLALPAGLEGELTELLTHAPSSPRAARALRDRLVELAPLASLATFSRWRADPEEIDARHTALLASLRARAPEGRGGRYRTRDSGLVVVTLLVRHRCELPEMPSGLDLEQLRQALQSCLPRDDEELSSVDVVVHPRDRADALDPAQVKGLFPELAPVGAPGRPCSSCEAPTGGAVCATCGASSAISAAA